MGAGVGCGAHFFVFFVFSPLTFLALCLQKSPPVPKFLLAPPACAYLLRLLIQTCAHTLSYPARFAQVCFWYVVLQRWTHGGV